MQSLETMDQLDRFLTQLQDNFQHYGNTLTNKKDALVKTADNIAEKARINANNMLSITKQGKEAIIQNKKFLTEMIVQADENKESYTKICIELGLLDRLYTKFERKLSEINQQVQQAVGYLRPHQSNGLNPERIQRFQLFTADETHVGDQCSVCMEDVEVGKLMRRLTCDGQHYFCHECIEGWFADHNTCPLCRHAFV